MGLILLLISLIHFTSTAEFTKDGGLSDT